MENLLSRRDEPLRAIVDPAGAAGRIGLRRFPPSPPFRHFVDYYWLVEWDRRGLPAEAQRVLPFPNAHLVFEPGLTAIHGVVRGAFLRTVTGAGRVLGVRFRPGGLRPLLDRPMAELTDRTLPMAEVFAMDNAEAEALVYGAATEVGLIAAVEAILAPTLPEPDPRAGRAAEAVALASAESGPVSVAALCARLGTEERALQRLFRDYVGVPPHWVIQRFRLQEAIWRLSRAEPVNLADLADELGFFDQAHLTRQFTRLVGRSPWDYQLSQRLPGSPAAR